MSLEMHPGDLIMHPGVRGVGRSMLVLKRTTDGLLLMLADGSTFRWWGQTTMQGELVRSGEALVLSELYDVDF